MNCIKYCICFVALLLALQAGAVQVLFAFALFIFALESTKMVEEKRNRKNK